MKGYWKHIAASVSITAVFVICALALTVSAVPVNAPAVEAASSEYHSASFADSFFGMIQAVDEAYDEVPAVETPAAETSQPAARAASAGRFQSRLTRQKDPSEVGLCLPRPKPHQEGPHG